jgi:hypothetical protein
MPYNEARSKIRIHALLSVVAVLIRNHQLLALLATEMAMLREDRAALHWIWSSDVI